MSDTSQPDSAPRQASLAAATPPPVAPIGSEAPTLDGVAERIGRYELRSLLGEGGMGRVYLAFDTELERPVALKVIHRHLVGNERILARFRQEARAVARLNHPGIVQIYEFGQDLGTPSSSGTSGDGPAGSLSAPFLAMEYIEGRSLAGLLDTRGPLALDQALRLALSAVQALEYALTQNIIHRDIKPANLLISRLGILKILDFGLARCLESDADLTQSGSIVGSPHYMSPEQGKGEKADHRSDIYSLGVTLFYMLSGVRPFEADSPLAIMLKHVQEPLPQSERIVPLVGGRVQALLERMTAKSPDDRFQTYAELRVELRELLSLTTSGASAVTLASPAASPAPAAGGSAPTPPFVMSDLLATQVLPQKVPSVDSAASVTVAALPAAASAAATAAPRHIWRFAILVTAAVVVALGLMVAGFEFYQASLSNRTSAASASVQPTPQAVAPSPAPAGPGGGRGARALQALDPATLERFFSADRLEANQARILGDRQAIIAEKIRKMDFAGAQTDLSDLRKSLEDSETPVDSARTLGITSFISVVGEMERFRDDIIEYIKAHAPVTVDQPGTPERSIRIYSANEDGLTVTLVEGATPFGRPWSENEDDPALVYHIGVKAYQATMTDEQRRRLTIFARYFGVAQAPGERPAVAPGAPGAAGPLGGGQRSGAGGGAARPGLGANAPAGPAGAARPGAGGGPLGRGARRGAAAPEGAALTPSPASAAAPSPSARPAAPGKTAP